MSEQNIEERYIIVVSNHGHPEKVRSENLLFLARGIYSKFGDSFTIEDPDGNIWRYDNRGDDSGHHEGRDKAMLKINEKHGLRRTSAD